MRSQAHPSMHRGDRPITVEELAKHNKNEDMWMALCSDSSGEANFPF